MRRNVREAAARLGSVGKFSECRFDRGSKRTCKRPLQWALMLFTEIKFSGRNRTPGSDPICRVASLRMFNVKDTASRLGRIDSVWE
jgi:hypothetical protein